MRADIAHLLAEFVDRDAEMDRFRAVLDEGGGSILVIWGDGGVGKSSLQAKMIHETANRTLRKSEVVWTDNRNHDYLAIMRKIRDDAGVESFKRFTDLINYFTVPQYELNINVQGTGPISVLEGGRIEQARVGDVAGIVIKDLMLSEPRADRDIPEAERMARLTDAFLACLAECTATDPLVVFLDAIEKMTDQTQRWVWEELLGAARQGRFPGITFVLCGRKDPELDRSWKHVAEVRQLRPLEREHIVDYLEKREVAEGREQLADLLLVTTQGNMLQLATYVDSYLEQIEEREA